MSLVFLLYTGSRGSLAASFDDCAMTEDQLEQMMSLSFRAFDQDMNGGWRLFYDKGCYANAAKLLRTYVERKPELAEKQRILILHTGQLSAMAGEYEQALHYLRWDLRLPKQINVKMDSEAFLLAHIAFISNDYASLVEARKRINQQEPFPDTNDWPQWLRGKKANLDVVDGFLHCFGQSFAEAYSQDCRDRAKQAYH